MCNSRHFTYEMNQILIWYYEAKVYVCSDNKHFTHVFMSHVEQFCVREYISVMYLRILQYYCSTLISTLIAVLLIIFLLPRLPLKHRVSRCIYIL